nr:zinc finger, CCHC-type [Tanacetum cinerariifolium]
MTTSSTSNSDKLHYLEQPIPPISEAPEGQQVAPEVLEAHYAWIKGSKEIVGLMLMSIDSEIQQNLEPLNAHEMLKELKTVCPASRRGASSDYERFSLFNAPALHAIQAGKVQKGNKHKKSHSQKGAKGKNQRKRKFSPKPKIPPPPKRENPAKDSICHECGEIGHWKRNCPQYLAELMKKKKNTASGAGGSGSKG